MVYYFSPFALDGNLGAAYNHYVETCVPNEDDWICFTDQDVAFIHEYTGNHINDYITTYPDTGLFTCFTNRVNNNKQRYPEAFNQKNIMYHIQVAQHLYQEKHLKTRELTKFISGMLMVFQKKTWRTVKGFPDGMLKVDNRFSYRILKAGMKIRRMDGIYVFHRYRLGTKNIRNPKHLKHG